MRGRSKGLDRGVGLGLRDRMDRDDTSSATILSCVSAGDRAPRRASRFRRSRRPAVRLRRRVRHRGAARARPRPRSMRLIEKPVCFKDGDLDSLGGRVRRSTRNARSRRSRFSSNKGTATDANGSDAARARLTNPKKPKNTSASLRGNRIGAVARMTILDDDSENDSGNAACAPSSPRVPAARGRRRVAGVFSRVTQSAGVVVESATYRRRPAYPYLSQKRSP